MTHRVNTRVFRAGKTLRWDFTAASTNLLEVTRLHYIAVTALQYILRRHGLEVFRVFIGLETHILLIRVIAYRRVVLRLEYDDVDLQAPFGVYSRALAARDSEEHFDEVKLVATPELPRLVRSNVRDFYYRYRKANVTSRIRVSSSGRGLLSRTDYSKGRSWLPIIKGERKGFDLQLLLRAERGLVPTFGSSAPFEAEIEEFFYAPEASLFTAELAAFYYSIGFVVVDALQVKTSASVRSRRAARIGAASCILAGRSITFLAGSGLRAGVGSRLSAIVPHLYGESLLSAFSGAAFNEAMRLAWARSIFSSAVEVSLVPALRVASKEKGLVVYFSLFSSILKSGVPFTRLEHARGSSVQHLILLLGCVRLLRATGGGGRRAPVSGVTARLTRLFLCALLYFKSDRYRVMRSLRLAPAISRKKVEAGRYRGEDREAQKWRALWLLARPGMTAVGTPEQTVAQAAAMCLRSWKS